MKSSPLIRASLELLGVPAGASAGDLKKAYHRLALLYHPDRNPDPSAAREFQKITEAFDLLCDENRMREADQLHFREKLLKPVLHIEGLEITFGSFFGHRIFNPARAMRRSNVAMLTGRGSRPTEASEDWGVFEESNSVLDHAAYDSLEAVYAGRFSVEDESLFMGELRMQELQRLPWVMLNNHGILSFFAGDLRAAKKSYGELCNRVPSNILFTYRLGLCYIIEAFQKPRRSLFGRIGPDRRLLESGVRLLRHCLTLGASRSVGRQRCLVIRKVLADVLEVTGRSRQARALWVEVHKVDPGCIEAALRVNGIESAIKMLRRRRAAAVLTANPGLRRLERGSSETSHRPPHGIRPPSPPPD